MGDIVEGLKYLYREFILRDILSFVTPGAIVVFPVLYSLFPGIRFEVPHWLLYIPFFGVLFMVGFAIQCFGEFVGIVRTQENVGGTWHQRLGIFRCWNESNIWWKEVHERATQFQKETKQDEDASRRVERLVVLKQMCGNCSIALAIAVILLMIASWWPQASRMATIVLAVVLVPFVYWGHRVHVLRQMTLTRAILKGAEGNSVEKH